LNELEATMFENLQRTLRELGKPLMERNNEELLRLIDELKKLREQLLSVEKLPAETTNVWPALDSGDTMLIGLTGATEFTTLGDGVTQLRLELNEASSQIVVNYGGTIGTRTVSAEGSVTLDVIGSQMHVSHLSVKGDGFSMWTGLEYKSPPAQIDSNGRGHVMVPVTLETDGGVSPAWIRLPVQFNASRTEFEMATNGQVPASQILPKTTVNHADMNFDNIVDSRDFDRYFEYYNEGNSMADVTYDGVVDSADVTRFMQIYNP
jgi:hypothetical protein